MLPLKTANFDDIDHIMHLENHGFAPGLTESEETLAKRISTFSDGFFMAFHQDTQHPVGYLSSELWGEDQRHDHNSFEVGHDIEDFHCDDGSSLYISSMTIHPEFQSHGLGRRLFSSSIRNLIAKYPQQIQEVTLMVNVTWKRAIKIYQGEGFEEVGRIEGIFTPLGIPPEDALIMRKIVNNP